MNTNNKIFGICTSVILCTSIFSGSTVLAAVEPDRGESAAQSNSAEYQPLGLRAGGLLFHPLIELKGAYDDNIYRLPDILERDDFIFHVSPSISMQSDWSRHALNANAFLDLAYYNDYSTEDWQDYGLSADGRIDVMKDSFFSGDVGYSRLHEDRTSLDDRAGVEPTQYDFGYFGLGYDHTFNRLSLAALFDYETLEYDNAENIFAQTIDNQDRDRDQNVLTLRVGYEVRPQFEIYLEGKGNTVDYDEQFDDSGRQRSSDGYRAVGGLSIDLTALLVGDIFLGYLRQTYDDPYFNDIDDMAYGFGLTWYATDMTTITTSLEQGPQETTEPTASGYLGTVFQARVDHELMRNIMLFGNVNYTDNDYEQSVPGQKEKENILNLGAGVKYLFTRRFYAAAEYSYERRDSDIELQEYSDNMAILTLGAQW